MMGAFLDGLGIKHEDGLIDTDDVPKPEPAALEKAAKAIVAALSGRGRAALLHDAADAGPGDLGRPRPSTRRRA